MSIRALFCALWMTSEIHDGLKVAAIIVVCGCAAILLYVIHGVLVSGRVLPAPIPEDKRVVNDAVVPFA